MSSLNKVQLIGSLGQDPEARSFQNGGEVVNLRIATSENWKDREGNRQERTQWHSVAIFAEGIGKVAKTYLRKGSKVYLEGQLETRKWQDQNGADRYTTEVVLRQFNSALVLLDKREGNHGVAIPQATSERRPAPAGFDDLDDDVPFISASASQEWKVG